MNTYRRLGAASLTIAASIGAAHAQSTADLPRYGLDPGWTGAYLGASVGGGGTLRRANANPGGATVNVDGLGGSGVVVSVHGGYDYRVAPQAVIGVLAEGTWSNMSGSLSAQVPGANANVTSQADLGFALMARGGLVVTPSTLLYGVGGYAGQNFRTNGFAGVGGAAASFTRNDYYNGWTVGGGLETLLTGNWSAKLEYRYSQFEQKSIPAGGVTVTPSMHTARVGLSYKFGDRRAESEVLPVTPGRRDWTGLYGGVAGGAGLMFNRLTSTAGGASASVDSAGQGLLGAVFVGGDYQIDDRFLVGVMGDLTWPGMQSMFTAGAGGISATLATRTNMSWNLLGRVGMLTSPSTLLYAAAGYTNQSFTTTGYSGSGATLFSSDDRLSGFTVGPGMELMIAKGWSSRFEYRYSQYENHALASGVTMQPSTHAVRAGLAYKFGIY